VIITVKDFGGLMPRLDPKALPIEAAQVATNCVFGSGVLRPIVSGAAVALNPLDLLTTAPKTIYKYTGDRWLSWTGDVDVCRSPVGNITSYETTGSDRIYMTDPSVAVFPRIADNIKALTAGGASVKPVGTYNLGVPKPVVPLTATAAAAVTEDKLFRSYVYTYVSAFGEEGPPSDPSGEIEVDPGATVTITGMSVSPGVDYNIVSKNIYRSATGSQTSDFQYVKSVLVAETGTTEDLTDLVEVIPSDGWFPPSPKMVGLTPHPGGFLVGYYNQAGAGVLCFSEPYLPHAWKTQLITDTIVAVGVYGNTIVVVTDGFPYTLSGSDPGSLIPERLETGEACTCKRAFVDMGYMCIYPGVTGLWGVGTGSVSLLTESIITEKEWNTSFSSQSVNPLLFAVQYGTQYIGFQETGGFIFDTLVNKFYTHTVNATAAFYDKKTGRLYLASDGLKEWGAGTTQKITWKSKLFETLAPTTFAVGQLNASGTVTAKIYCNGTIINGINGQEITDSKPFRLPAGYVSTLWEIQLEGYCDIHSFSIASSVPELN
jgi:hypothetical protein